MSTLFVTVTAKFPVLRSLRPQHYTQHVAVIFYTRTIYDRSGPQLADASRTDLPSL